MSEVIRRKLLWVGDAGCPSGFARSTHEILEGARHKFDVTVLGINYRGDPHDYPYPIYAAAPGGDTYGIGRLIWMCDKVKPDLIVIQQDPWNFKPYMNLLKQFPEHADIPVVGVVAVDGKNCRGDELNDLELGVFWTKYGQSEARRGGFTGRSVVIPLGVDVDLYHPKDQLDARSRKLPRELDDVFIVGNVNRNQSRKRLDLSMRYFAEWTRHNRITDAYLYLHIAPTGDSGIDALQLARYYGIADRLALAQPAVWYGDTDEQMVDTYNCFDVQISTTQGEGFGLTTFEGMACGIPQIVPDWSALGELCKGAALLVPCTSTATTAPFVNTIGGVADEAQFITALDSLYRSKFERETLGARGRARVHEERFRWANIATEVTSALETVRPREQPCV